MPTIFTHPAVPLGLSPWFRRLPRSLIVLAAIASAIPDIDVLSFRLGIPYESPLGHRGFTHSLTFAMILALLLSLVWRGLSVTRAASLCGAGNPAGAAVSLTGASEATRGARVATRFARHATREDADAPL